MFTILALIGIVIGLGILVLGLSKPDTEELPERRLQVTRPKPKRKSVRHGMPRRRAA